MSVLISNSHYYLLQRVKWNDMLELNFKLPIAYNTFLIVNILWGYFSIHNTEWYCIQQDTTNIYILANNIILQMTFNSSKII